MLGIALLKTSHFTCHRLWWLGFLYIVLLLKRTMYKRRFVMKHYPASKKKTQKIVLLSDKGLNKSKDITEGKPKTRDRQKRSQFKLPWCYVI